MRHRVRASVRAIFLIMHVLLFFRVIRARTRPTLVTVGESHLSLHLHLHLHYIYIYIYIYLYYSTTSFKHETNHFLA